MVTLTQVRNMIRRAIAPLKRILRNLHNLYKDLKTKVIDLRHEQNLIRLEFEELRDQIQDMREIRIEEGRDDSSFSRDNPNASDDRSHGANDDVSFSGGGSNGVDYDFDLPNLTFISLPFEEC